MGSLNLLSFICYFATFITDEFNKKHKQSHTLQKVQLGNSNVINDMIIL